MIASPPRAWSRPPLPKAAAMLALGLYAVGAATNVVREVLVGTGGLDFGYNRSAALIGLRHGWAALYDRQLYGAATHNGGPLSYANTPVVAWLTVPFAGLPFRLGLALWLLPLVAMLLLAWWLVAPGAGWRRLGHLVALLAAAPVLFGVYLGQFSLAVMGLLALHWWLLRRERPVLAGVVLGLACLKPQDAFLVPVALALAARWRCLGAWAATVAALALATAAALGPAGVAAYLDQLAGHSLDDITTAYTLWSHLPGWLPGLPLRLAVAALALVPALIEGRTRIERPMAAALVGSMLATPYLNWQDLGLLVLAGWLVLRAPLPVWARRAMVPSYVAVAFPAGPIPPLCAALAWLLVLAWLAVKPAGRRAGVPATTAAAGRP